MKVIKKIAKLFFQVTENQIRVNTFLMRPLTRSIYMEDNMAYQNAYTAYQRTNINTASQGRLVVLLYEGAVKNLTTALNLFGDDDKLKPKDIETFGNHMQKAQAIITELQVSLDMEKGGDIAKNLMSLYIYFNEEIMSIIINRDKKKLGTILGMIRDLTDSWRQIANSTANAPAAKVSNALNIEG